MQYSVSGSGLSRDSNPPFWLNLQDKKKGNSDYADRINLIDRFVKIFGKQRIRCVMGDREFVGKKWIDWLRKQKIPYVLRLKENGQYVACSQGKMTLAKHLFHDLKPGEFKLLGSRRVGKTDPYLSHVCGLSIGTDQVLVLLFSESIENPWNLYRERWQIEVLFKAIKSGGFDLEATHITQHDRLDTLLGVVALTCVIAYKAGMCVNSVEPPVLKKHGFKPHSIIRSGIDFLIRWIRATFDSSRPFRDVDKKIWQLLQSTFCSLPKIVM